MRYKGLFWTILLALVCIDAQVEPDCLECMCKADSNCKSTKCRKENQRYDGRRRVCGFYKLSQKYFDECGNPGLRYKENNRKAWERCAQDRVCSGQCVLAFATKHEDETCLIKRNHTTCEMMARNHFAGPGGCQRPMKTNGYWRRVQKCLFESNNKLNPKLKLFRDQQWP